MNKQFNQVLIIMCYILVYLKLRHWLENNNKKKKKKWKMKIIREEVNPFQPNKQEMILSGKKKIKFFIIPISHFLTMKRIKILSTSTPFSWKKSPINLAKNGNFKLTNFLNPMHRVEKFSWTSWKYGSIIILSPMSTIPKKTQDSHSISPTCKNSINEWNKTSKGNLVM